MQANFGTTVSQELARMRVHDGLELKVSMPNFFQYRAQAQEDGINGWSVTPSNLEQMNEITEIFDEGLRQGAIGIGSTIRYAQKGITTYEMFEAQKAAARWKRLTAVHHRFHPSASTPTEAPTGVNEVLVNALLLKSPLQIHHNNDFGWWEIEEKLHLARKEGNNVWSTWYSWDAGSGNAGATILQPLTWESPYEEYSGHPRTAGTHAKVVRLGRENNVPLMHTLSQLSYWEAKHLGDTGLEAMKQRGRIQEGMVADLVIFDPINVAENATYKAGENGKPSSGIPYVLVNGIIVVRDSKVLKDVNPGQPIRFPVEVKGRFEPATKENLLRTLTIDTPHLGPDEHATD